MAIKVINNIDLSIKLKKITQDLAINLATELKDVAAEINVRTASGKMIEGGTFPKYADFTKKKKESQSKQSSPVNLTETGKMLTAADKVTIKETNTGIIGTISFSDSGAAQKGLWNQKGDARKNRPARPWFGLSEKQRKGIMQRLRGK